MSNLDIFILYTNFIKTLVKHHLLRREKGELEIESGRWRGRNWRYIKKESEETTKV